MIAQYQKLKALHPECLLFFRMGDFYELFFEDAKQAAPALDIALTKRGRHGDDDIPMCGVPVHSSDGYLERLIKKGFKVAICEQTEDPAEAKKRGPKSVVRREIIRLVTPGTLTEDSLLEARRHNFLAAIASSQRKLGLAWLDMSTGEFLTEPIVNGGLGPALARIEPGELLLADALFADDGFRERLLDWDDRLSPLPDRDFASETGERRLQQSFDVKALDGFGQFTRAELGACGALINYVELTQKGRLPHLSPPRRIMPGSHMVIDSATRRNLELLAGLNGERRGSLVASVDRTVTGAGGRLLAARLATPARRSRTDQATSGRGTGFGRRPRPSRGFEIQSQGLSGSGARPFPPVTRTRRPARPLLDPPGIGGSSSDQGKAAGSRSAAGRQWAGDGGSCRPCPLPRRGAGG